jgi:hypothetical protein
VSNGFNHEPPERSLLLVEPDRTDAVVRFVWFVVRLDSACGAL